MTGTTVATRVSRAMALAIVDEARAKGYRSGVIGVHGELESGVPEEAEHAGCTVRFRRAESALAVREVLADQRDSDWLVVVTDRDDADLGAGVLAHFVWQRLRSPDPWEAVRTAFHASGIDPALTARPGSRDLAAALIEGTPDGGWPSAPAGVLTRAHALGAVASTRLKFGRDTADVLAVLRWSMTAGSVTALADLRRRVGDLLADTTLDWIAERAGTAAAPIRALLARGELADVAPLGVVLHLLTAAESADPQTGHQAQLARARLEPRWGEPKPGEAALRALGQAAQALVADLLHDRRADDDVRRALERADAILNRLEAGPLARHSDLLASGLRARLVLLADAVRHCVDPAHAGGVDEVERAWAGVVAHRLARQAPEYAPFEAAVRLVRWLALPSSPEDALVAGSVLPAGGALLAELARHHLDTGAWVDAALHDAFVGVDDPDLSPALQAVVAAASARRQLQERAFASALAAGTPTDAPDRLPGTTGTVWYLERLLPAAVIPLAKKTPLLLLVLDGMSAATATEIVADITGRLGWLEAALPGADERRRSAALAVLPSITEVSRASLLCGRLTRGTQTAEQAGYAALTSQVGKITAKLFHKKGVDTTAAGWSVSHDVADALDDEDLQLVTVVLNTIDDALDRSDPGGTTWTADAVKHLEPLLARAAATNRTVVLTADHGHVIERRQGTQKTYPGITSARSRPGTGTVDEGEIEVSGPRVLVDGHRAVLAVDDTLRYGPLKAGYHGGGSAAEVVVPVVALVRDESTNPAELPLLPPQMPAWWFTAPALLAPTGDAGVVKVKRSAATAPPVLTVYDDGGTLFDLEPAPALAPQPDLPESIAVAPVSLGESVVKSRVFKGQWKVAGRLIVTDEQVARLVDALAAANATRLPSALAAQALGVAQPRLRGALTQVQQLLNVEGYAVLAVEAATGATILDVALLKEQFGVRS